MPDEHAPDSTSNPGDTPAQSETLQEQLDRLQRELVEAQKSQKNAEVRIAALTQLVADTEKIVEEYRKEQPTVAKVQKTYEEYKDNEVACLRQILGDTHNQVAPTVKNVRDQLVALENEVKTEEATLVQIRSERDAAVKKRDDLKAALEMWKKVVASIKTRHGKLDALTKEIRTAHDNKDFAVAYWLLIDAEKFTGKLSESPRVLSPEELKQKLEDTWNEYSRSIEEAQECESKLKTAEKTLDAKKTSLEDRKKKIDANNRTELSKLLPQRQAA